MSIRLSDVPEAASIPSTPGPIRLSDIPEGIGETSIRSRRITDLPPWLAQTGAGALRTLQATTFPGWIYNAFLARKKAQALEQARIGNFSPIQEIERSQEAERQSVKLFPAERAIGGLIGSLPAVVGGGAVAEGMVGPAFMRAASQLPWWQRGIVTGEMYVPTLGGISAAERAQRGLTQGVPTSPRDVATSGLMGATLSVPLGVAGSGASELTRFAGQKAWQSVLNKLESEFIRQNPAATPEMVDSFKAGARYMAAKSGIRDVEQGPGLIRSGLMRARLARQGVNLGFPEGQPPTPQEPLGLTAPEPRPAPIRVTPVRQEPSSLSIPTGARRYQQVPTEETGALEQAGSVGEPKASEIYQEKAPIFYSQLERAISDRMPNSTTPQQVMGIIRGTPGVKQEEVDWTGINEFLEGKKKVSKQELLDYVRANNVQIQEVQKPETNPEQLRHIKESTRQSVLTEGQPLFQSKSGETSTFKEEEDKLQSLLGKHGIKDVVIRLVPEITTPSGTKAAGSFVPGERLVKLTPTPLKTTGYHEAFHVLVRNSGLEESYQEVLSSIPVQFGVNREEALADQFAEYVNDRENPRWTSKIRQFFENILNFIKRLIGRGSKSKQLFENLLKPEGEVVESRAAGHEKFQEIERKGQAPVSLNNARILRRMLRRSDVEGLVRSIARDYLKKAKVMQESGRSLFSAIRTNGGIRPYEGGAETEEFRPIPWHLKNLRDGLPLDKMAQVLQEQGFPFQDGEELRNGILAVGSLKRVSMKDFMEKARSIVEAEAQEILRQDILSKTTLSNVRASIRRAVRMIRAKQRTELSKAAVVLDAAKLTNLTPRQLSMYAQAFLGKKGTERITSRDVGQLVPALKKGFSKTGGPNQPPPVVTRKRAVVPYYEPGNFKDLTAWQTAQGSGLEPRLAAEIVDRSADGPTKQKWLALRTGEIESGREWKKLNNELLRFSGRILQDSPLAHAITDLLENTAKGVPPPKAVQVAAWLQQEFDALLNRINEWRSARNLKPIVKRHGYMTHLQQPDLWAELRGMATGEDPKKLMTLGDLVPAALKPSFRFGKPRLGGPYAIDPIHAFQVYSRAALRVLALSDPAKALSSHLEQLPPNAQAYFRRVIKQSVSGWPGEAAQALPKPLVKGISWMTSRFSRGTVLGNASSVVMQPWTLASTMGSLTDPRHAGTAVIWMGEGHGFQFADQWSKTFQGRSVEGLDPGLLSGYAQLTDKLAGAMTGVDRTMVAHSFLSNYLDQIALGKTHAQAVETADDLAAKAQAEFLRSTLAPIFADELLRGFVPFQTTINTTFNYIKVGLLNPPGGTSGWSRAHRDAWRAARSAEHWRRAALFAGTVAAMIAIYDRLGLPRPKGIMDWVPGLSSFRGGPPTVRLATDLAAGLSSPQEWERQRAWKNMLRSLGVTLVGPPANQLFKSWSGIQAVAEGGKRSKTGRLQFPVQGPAESARALAFGPYQTKAGQVYIQRGFKPEPSISLRRKSIRQILKSRSSSDLFPSRPSVLGQRRVYRLSEIPE